MVSIIILSYNTKEILLRCLHSLSQKLADESIEVIVVDNGSSDGSADAVRKSYPGVNLVESKENLGFAKGVNLGAKQAKGNYILVLNSDTQLKENGLGKIIKTFAENNKIGAIGGKMLEQNGSVEKSYGKFYTIASVFQTLFGPERRSEIKQTASPVDWVSGGCFFVRKDVFEKIHGFDEKIFMYVEDVEICYRIKKAGYEILYDPSFVVTHLGQGSSNRAFAISQIYKGITYYFSKHKSKGALFFVTILLYSKAFAAIFIGFITKNKILQKTYVEALRAL